MHAGSLNQTKLQMLFWHLHQSVFRQWHRFHLPGFEIIKSDFQLKFKKFYKTLTVCKLQPFLSLSHDKLNRQNIWSFSKFRTCVWCLYTVFPFMRPNSVIIKPTFCIRVFLFPWFRKTSQTMDDESLPVTLSREHLKPKCNTWWLQVLNFRPLLIYSNDPHI